MICKMKNRSSIVLPSDSRFFLLIFDAHSGKKGQTPYETKIRGERLLGPSWLVQNILGLVHVLRNSVKMLIFGTPIGAQSGMWHCLWPGNPPGLSITPERINSEPSTICPPFFMLSWSSLMFSPPTPSYPIWVHTPPPPQTQVRGNSMTHPPSCQDFESALRSRFTSFRHLSWTTRGWEKHSRSAHTFGASR